MWARLCLRLLHVWVGRKILDEFFQVELLEKDSGFSLDA